VEIDPVKKGVERKKEIMSLPLPFNLNWVDLLIILIIVFFLVEGFRHGFWVILADFLSFLLSLLIALRFYPFVSEILKGIFTLSRSVSNALGFLIAAIVAELLLGYIFGIIISKLPSTWKKNPWSKYLSVFPALGEALVLVAFILILLIGLPINPSIKVSMAKSRIGGVIIEKTQSVEVKTSDIFGGVVDDTITYLTIDPSSQKRVILTAETLDLEIDEVSEKEIFDLINKERRDEGISELNWDESIVPVAREHAKDMWERRYFGHVSPEGKDIGDRLDIVDFDYFIAGENLALAPTTTIAHTGLMNSEGHRANILEDQFERVSVGVVENGVYGKMIVQVFIK
jgi:uncharacterized protein YkwD